MLSSAKELVDAFGAGGPLAEWNIEDVADDHVLASKRGVTLGLVWPGLWPDGADWDTFSSEFDRVEGWFCCVTDEEESPGWAHGKVSLPVSPQVLAATLNLGHRLLTKGRELADRVKRLEYENKLLSDIGRALSSERDTERLLRLILARAREVTNADAGSIYVVEGDDQARELHFVKAQNDSRRVRSKGFKLGVSESSIVGTCVLRKETINIADLYALDRPGHGNNPWGFVHDRSLDRENEYQTRSMLTIPLISGRGEVIGVVQLINRRRPGVRELVTDKQFEEDVMPFEGDVVALVEALASQAGVALENARLYEEVRGLFEGFVKASVNAIEARDPTTSGHSVRVADLTVELAKVVDRASDGRFTDTTFDPNQLREIEYAALLHDFGKVGVREHVLVKAAKLYQHQRQIIESRFAFIRRTLEVENLESKVQLLLDADRKAAEERIARADSDVAAKLKELDDFVLFILRANQPTILEEQGFDRLEEIASRTYIDATGTPQPYLCPDELHALKIARGSLTEEERREIESHVVYTEDFLQRIPWGSAFRDIPIIAGAHHEKLDGSGYPRGLTADEIPVQAKMMTIADIFDALTASDRPYKKAVPLDRALDILRSEVKNGKLDQDLFDMFLEAKVFDILDSL